MKVTKAQVQANREHIVETASTLFRERGFDGIGVADLMAAAGFTHGGFYKHFESKAELMAQAAACGLARSSSPSEGADEAAFVRQYLSRAHRDTPGDGCTFAALGTDAARQPSRVKSAFEAGLEDRLSALGRDDPEQGSRAKREQRAHRISAFAHLVGAIVLSRACPDDSPLADEILEACRSAILPKRGAARRPTRAPRRATPRKAA